MAFDGQAALGAMDERLADVLVLDVEMPVLDGPGIAHQMILEDRGLEAIPIVLTSAVVQLQKIAARIGTPCYLAKSYQPSELLALVARSAQERVAPCPPIPGGSSPCKLS